MIPRSGSLLLLLPALFLAPACSSDEEEEGLVSNRTLQKAFEDAGTPEFTSGRWRVRLEVSDVKLPGLAASRRNKIISRIEQRGSGSICLKARDASRPPPEFFAGRAKDCRYRKAGEEDGKLHLELSCGLEDISAVDMQLDGEIAPSEYDMDAVIDLRLPMVGKVDITGKLTAKRVGDCAGG